jgi:hypothetical protein
LFERALVLDPKNIEAMVGLASVGTVVGGAYFADSRLVDFRPMQADGTRHPDTGGTTFDFLGFTPSRASRGSRGDAGKGILSLAPNHALAHSLLGAVQMYTNRAAQGIAECEASAGVGSQFSEGALAKRPG